MLQSFWKLIRLRLRPDPGIHFGDAEAGLPAILPGYWRSIYWLALASRCSIWYFERNFERRRRPGTGDWPDPSGW
jgi:hypothetical protein